MQQAFDPSRVLTVSDASDSVQRAADLAGSRTFGAISTGGRVLIGGALTLARGGSFEDGVLTTVGSIAGQEVGETVGQGLNQAFDGVISTGVTSYIGRVLGAGLSAELVNQRGGRGDIAFLNAVVDATVATIKPSYSDSVIFAQGPDQSAAETERLGRQSLSVDAAINAPAPNLVGDTPITPVTSPTVVNNATSSQAAIRQGFDRNSSSVLKFDPVISNDDGTWSQSGRSADSTLIVRLEGDARRISQKLSLIGSNGEALRSTTQFRNDEGIRIEESPLQLHLTKTYVEESQTIA